MPNAWQYKVVDLPHRTAVQRIEDNVKGMDTKEGSFPVEVSFHGRLGGGLYGYAYPFPLERLEIYTEDIVIEGERPGTLLKHKPKNTSILNPFTAVDVSTRVSGDILCELDRDAGEDLIAWIEENYESFLQH